MRPAALVCLAIVGGICGMLVATVVAMSGSECADVINNPAAACAPPAPSLWGLLFGGIAGFLAVVGGVWIWRNLRQRHSDT